MTQAINPSAKFHRIFWWSLACIVVTAGIWLTTIAWWQHTQRVVTLHDVVIYLLVGPLAAMTVIALFRWMSGQKARSAKRAEIALSAASLSDLTSASMPSVAATVLPIMAAWCVNGTADNANDFIQTLHEKRHRPCPDAGLLDDAGFPIYTKRVKDLDISSIQHELERAAGIKEGEWRHAEDYRASFLRSLALLSALLDMVCHDWPFLSAPPDTSNMLAHATLRGAQPSSMVRESRLGLQIKLIIPAGFQVQERQLALAYFLEKSSRLELDPALMQIDLVTTQDDATALILADQFRVSSLKTSQPQALLLLACESTLCATIADEWQAAGKIFSSTAPNGLMMGEAACAVLCINETARQLALTEPLCSLSPVIKARRESSADLPGRHSSSVLAEVLGETLSSAGIAGDKIGSVACDADHRTSRVLECIGAMMQHTPQLDAIANRLATNEACGHTGAASVLNGLVAGALQVRDAGYPVLLFNVSHVLERAAAVLIPPADAQQPS